MTPTREQVIEWAKEAGFVTGSLNSIDPDEVVTGGPQFITDELERFATLAHTAGRDQGLREVDGEIGMLREYMACHQTMRTAINPDAFATAAARANELVAAIEQRRASAATKCWASRTARSKRKQPMNTTEALNNALEFVEELDRELTLSSNLELKRGRLEQEIVRALAAQPANAPAAEPVSVREIDYTELIRAGFKLHGYAQGTRGCVAFKHGAEWFRSVCDTNAQPASEPMTREWRLLNAGEPIEACDELLEDDCVTWGALVGWEVGLAYNPTLNVPMRRRITIQDGGKVKAELTRLEATPDTATK